ncbi:MAG: hypothetical protein LUD02_05675 [Tannerellaceae bacterium]|nr:hypothetical protein [Tannerellaceae bacterium]
MEKAKENHPLTSKNRSYSKHCPVMFKITLVPREGGDRTRTVYFSAKTGEHGLF